MTSVSREIFGHNWLNPSVSKSNWLHVVIFQCSFFYKFEVYSIDFSKVIGIFLEVLNFDKLFLKINRFICIQLRVELQCHYKGLVLEMLCIP
jgi:hypothetical protein